MAEKLHYDSNDRDDGTIRSCPFCGSAAFVAAYNPSFTRDHYFYIVCEDCGASSKLTAKTVGEAIKDWNRREDEAAYNVGSKTYGVWLATNDRNKLRCSNCDVIHLIAQYPHGNINFCPNCGADMRESNNG